MQNANDVALEGDCEAGRELDYDMEQVVQEGCSERPGLLAEAKIIYDSDPTAAEGDGSGSGSPAPLPHSHELAQLVAPLESRCDSEAPEASGG